MDPTDFRTMYRITLRSIKKNWKIEAALVLVVWVCFILIEFIWKEIRIEDAPWIRTLSLTFVEDLINISLVIYGSYFVAWQFVNRRSCKVKELLCTIWKKSPILLLSVLVFSGLAFLCRGIPYALLLALKQAPPSQFFIGCITFVGLWLPMLLYNAVNLVFAYFYMTLASGKKGLVKNTFSSLTERFWERLWLHIKLNFLPIAIVNLSALFGIKSYLSVLVWPIICQNDMLIYLRFYPDGFKRLKSLLK